MNIHLKCPTPLCRRFITSLPSAHFGAPGSSVGDWAFGDFALLLALALAIVGAPASRLRQSIASAESQR